MELKEAIEILENVMADEVIGTYCLEIQKKVDCYKNCENEDCFLQQAIDTVLKELDRQKQVKAEMRKVVWEEGYNQGYIKGVMDSI